MYKILEQIKNQSIFKDSNERKIMLNKEQEAIVLQPPNPDKKAPDRNAIDPYIQNTKRDKKNKFFLISVFKIE